MTKIPEEQSVSYESAKSSPEAKLSTMIYVCAVLGALVMVISQMDMSVIFFNL